VAHAAYFGSALHVSGYDQSALLSAIQSHTSNINWQAVEPSLEDVFIALMEQCRSRQTELPMSSLSRSFLSSISRLLAIANKELIQMRRDRMTFAMMLGVPMMQLMLFGYAINTDPKLMPTAVVTEEAKPCGAHYFTRAAKLRLLSSDSPPSRSCTS